VQVFPAGHKEAPRPVWEFYRRRSVDYDEVDPGIRELVDEGLLDLRAVKESLVRLAR
jgi:hypothetical protein